jgi:hypothetical protein
MLSADEKKQGEFMVSWKDLAKEAGLKPYKPAPGTRWYPAVTFSESVLDQYFDGMRELQESDKREIMARGQDEEWAIPEDVATTMDTFKPLDTPTWIGELAERAQRGWKKYILIMPFRVLKYNLNNMSGDLDIVLAASPRVLKYAYRAAKDMWRWTYKKGDVADIAEEMLRLTKEGTIGSGWARVETKDVTVAMDEKAFLRALSGEKKNLPEWIQARWHTLQNFTIWRENILRLAAHRYMMDELKAGRMDYGVSNPSEMDALVKNMTHSEVASKFSRELIGDYGNISPAGEWLRKKVMPFWAWKEINAPRYLRLFRNIPHTGRSPGEMLAPMSAAFARKAAGVTFKAGMLYGAVTLYNSLFFPDEEEELGMTGRRQLHLILGRRPDGSIMTLRFQGALSDALNWLGAEDFGDDVKDLATGKKSFYEWLEETGKAPFNTLFQGVGPQYKTPAELITGKAVWPDVWKPKPIRDRMEHLMRVFALDKVYQPIAGKPLRGQGIDGKVLEHVTNLLVYSADPQEIAYHEIRQEANKFLQKHQLVKPGIEPTDRSNALYYYKQALKYGDIKAAKKYLAKYVELGGTLKGLKISIKLAHPLAGIPVKYRTSFVQSLSKEDRARLKRAIQWYDNTYLLIAGRRTKG